MQRIPAARRFPDISREIALVTDHEERLREYLEVYLDDAAWGENWARAETEAHVGSPGELQEALREVFQEWGIARSSAKANEQEMTMEARGALLDGRAGRAYPCCAKVWRALSSTWWICGRRRVPLPYALSGAGLWCFCCQFRRPAFSCLERTWEVLEESTPSRERRNVLTEEFLLLAMILPLLVIDWRAGGIKVLAGPC